MSSLTSSTTTGMPATTSRVPTVKATIVPTRITASLTRRAQSTRTMSIIVTSMRPSSATKVGRLSKAWKCAARPIVAPAAPPTTASAASRTTVWRLGRGIERRR